MLCLSQLPAFQVLLEQEVVSVRDTDSLEGRCCARPVVTMLPRGGR